MCLYFPHIKYKKLMSIPHVNLRKRLLKSGKTSYYIDYRVNGKRYRTAAGLNRYDAKKIQDHIQHQLAMGAFNIDASTRVIVSVPQLVEAFVKSKMNLIKHQSIHRYKNYFSKFETFILESFSEAYNDISLITPSYFKESIDYLSTKPIKGNKPWAPKTIAEYINAIRMLFKFAVQRGYIEKNPAIEVSKPKIGKKAKEDFYYDTDLEKIYSIVDEFWVDQLKFIVNTGLRKSELIHLRWENVFLDPDNSHIHIKGYKLWTPKTSNERIIPLPKEAIKILEKQREKQLPDVYVFPGKNGEIQHPDRIYRALKKATNKLGLPGTIHTLRHTYASNLLMSGATQYDVMKLLGHTDIKSTDIYSHLSDNHLHKVVSKLNQ